MAWILVVVAVADIAILLLHFLLFGRIKRENMDAFEEDMRPTQSFRIIWQSDYDQFCPSSHQGLYPSASEYERIFTEFQRANDLLSINSAGLLTCLYTLSPFALCLCVTVWGIRNASGNSVIQWLCALISLLLVVLCIVFLFRRAHRHPDASAAAWKNMEQTYLRPTAEIQYIWSLLDRSPVASNMSTGEHRFFNANLPKRLAARTKFCYFMVFVCVVTFFIAVAYLSGRVHII